jgi:undecaprenyl-diphosphatase
LKELLANPKQLIPYLIALLPLIPAYFLLKPVRLWASQPHLLGVCLFITAVILFVAQRIKKGSASSVTWKNALWVGAMQSVALVPGISRSASTITGGLWQGMTARAAARFSFILSIPAVAGGAFLEVLKSSHHPSVAWDGCCIGLGVSALVGLALIRVAIPLLEKGTFRPFAWYCLIVSILLSV